MMDAISDKLQLITGCMRGRRLSAQEAATYQRELATLSQVIDAGVRPEESKEARLEKLKTEIISLIRSDDAEAERAERLRRRFG